MSNAPEEKKLNFSQLNSMMPARIRYKQNPEPGAWRMAYVESLFLRVKEEKLAEEMAAETEMQARILKILYGNKTLGTSTGRINPAKQVKRIEQHKRDLEGHPGLAQPQSLKSRKNKIRKKNLKPKS